jgi:protease-4
MYPPMLSKLMPFVLLLVAGCGMPSFLITPVGNTSTLEESVVEEGKGSGKIAIIELEGMLANMKSGGLFAPTENKMSLFVQQLEKAAKDSSVKAVVLRVNSPGGTVTATDTMYQLIQRFKKETHKPVIASTQEVAASGGYYVACAADKIVAHPTSVVGSIGVIFYTFDASGTMSKIGLRSEAIKSAPMKDIGSPFRPSTAEERAVMQGMVDEYYGRFKEVVVANRPIKDAPTLKLVSDGRVFSGAQCVELGLADQTGMLSDAIELARKMAKAPGAEVVLYKRPYGYTGSIYASSELPAPTAQGPSSLNVELPGARSFLPTGFYYVWEPMQ